LSKTKCHPKNEVNKANREVGFMKNEIPSLLMDEKVCFMRLSPDTLQNFWQVIPTKWKCRELNQNTFHFRVTHPGGCKERVLVSSS
jgi:hypothetical protein